MIVIAALFLKPLAWYIAFKSGTIENLNKMLLWSCGITIFLTVSDKISVISNLKTSAVLLTFFLYALMSFILLPLAWKLKTPKLSYALNFLGTVGAFAGVNFIMDFIRGFFPIFNQ